MPKFTVASVPHTGTHFVLQELLGGRERGPDLHVAHTYPEQMPGLRAALGTTEHLLVPLRDPLSVARSFKVRGKDPLDSIPLWWNLIDLVEEYESLACYFPLDKPELRGPHLWFFNAISGEQVDTDWPIVRGEEERDLGRVLSPEEMRAISEMLLSRSEIFFEDFGYLT